MARTETIELKIGIASFDQGMAKELSDARANVAAIENRIIRSFQQSDRFKALEDFSGRHEMGGKRSVVPPRISGLFIEAQVIADVADKPAAAPSYFNIAEKTANLLLSGKLLNDEQKKALIKRMGFDLDAI